MEYLLRVAGPKKIESWIQKQIELCNYFWLQDYADYIRQCKQLEYNLDDKAVIMPQNFSEAHTELSILLQQRDKEKRFETLYKLQENFQKDLLPKLEKKSFSDGNYIIRPARTVEELAQEGAKNHNCVFTNYAEEHLSGKTELFFIRDVNAPDETFYTVEYHNGDVIQCRTLRNQGATNEVQAFVDKWLKYIKQIKSKGKADAA